MTLGWILIVLSVVVAVLGGRHKRRLGTLIDGEYTTFD